MNPTMNSTNTRPMLKANTGHSGTLQRTTVRLSSADRVRLQELNATYRDLLGQRVSTAVIFHRAIAVLQNHLRYVVANQPAQDVAASERVQINKA